MSAETTSTFSTGYPVSTLSAAIERVPTIARKGISISAVLVTWWALVELGVLGFEFFVTPVETAVAFAHHLRGAPLADGASIYTHAAYSTGRVFLGVGLAILVAIPLGLAIGTYQTLERFVFPSIELLRPIPPIAWVPLVLVLFPTTASGVLFVVFLGAFFPMVINTLSGATAVDRDYLRAAKSLGASDWELIRHVILPAALPSILTGITIGVGIGWITVVAAEMITGEFGLGHVIFQAYRLIEIQTVVVGMITIGALGAFSTALVNRIGTQITPWVAQRQTEGYS